MRDEVEEFLRRAAQRRAQVEAQARAAQGQAAAPRPSAQAPKRRLVQQADPLIVLQPVDAQVVEAELAESGDRLGAGVAQHMRGMSSASEHSVKFASQVDLADDDMDAHLRQVFDHKLGSLKSTPITNATGAAASPSLQLVATATQTNLLRMLRTPTGMRDAIIISEVLRRPEERW